MSINKIKILIKKVLRINKKFEEEIKSYGELNKDKNFYIIRRTPPGAGLLSNYSVVLAHLLEAKRRNLIPIVDYKNYNSHYKEKEKIRNTENMWEYFWKQPTSIALDEVYKSKNVILSSELPKNLWWENIIEKIKNKDLKEIKEIATSVELNEEIKNEAEELYEKIFLKNKNILGVKVRGSDYNNAPKSHPIQPSINEVIEVVKEKIVTWKIDYIFLVTEEEETIKIFKDIFKDKLLYIDCPRISNYGKKTAVSCTIRHNRRLDKYLSGKEYLIEVYLLAKCNYLIGAINSSVIIANIWTKGYKDIYIFDKGVY